LAFTTSARTKLLRSDVDGSHVELLPSSCDYQCIIGQIAVSADGREIAYTANVPGIGNELRVMSADGTGDRVVVGAQPSRLVGVLAFRPRSRRLAYTWWSPTSFTGGVSEVDIDSGASTGLFSDGNDRWGPSFSPDGSHLYFGENCCEAGAPGMFIAAPDGSDPQRLPVDTPDDYNMNSSLVFSPDGSRLAFSKTTVDNEDQIWVAGSDGSGAHPIVTDWFPIPLGWSTDDTLVLSRHTNDGEDIVSVNADGTEFTKMISLGHVASLAMAQPLDTSDPGREAPYGDADNGNTPDDEFGDLGSDEGCPPDEAGGCLFTDDSSELEELHANPAPQYGIADQGDGSFINTALFSDLKVRWLRTVVPWDMMIATDPGNAAQKSTFDRWYSAIVAYNGTHDPDIKMVVSFGRSRRAAGKNLLPDPSGSSSNSYRTAVTAFRQAYPQVTYFTAWNEPNDGNQPTRISAVRAARYWVELDDQCNNTAPRCYVAAGEFVDQNALRFSYVDTYIRGIKNYGSRMPSNWAWHAYVAGKTGSTSKFRSLLRRVGSRPKIWLTEQGGIMRRDFKEINTPAAATNHLDNILTLAARANTGQVAKLFVYQWAGDAKYDAGLVDYTTGVARPLYCKLRSYSNPAATTPCP